MSLRLRTLSLAAGLLLFAAAPGQASTILFATLSNAQENPPVVPKTSLDRPRPASYGFATFELNDAMTSMTYSATIFNIDVNGTQTPDDVNDNLTNAHIHAGPAVTATTNGPVVWGFVGSPFNDINPNDLVFTPFASGVGGTFSGKWDAPEGNNMTTLAAQLPFILSNRSYINFHTVQFGGGEIRGTLVATPEPATLVLFGLGGAAMSLRRRFAKKR